MATMKIGISIKDDFNKDIEKFCKNAAFKSMQKVADDMTEAAQDAIRAFYADYDPTSYRRHKPLMYNFMQSIVREYKNYGHGYYLAGVVLDPGLMDDIYYDGYRNDDGSYSTPTEEVFDLVYHGFHGIAGAMGSIPRMQPSPWALIEEKQDMIVESFESEYLQQYGIPYAMKQKYAVLNFS